MQFAILGALRIVDDDGELDLRAPKLRVLLALLLIHGGSPVSLDTIVDALWGDAEPDGAESTVYVYVSRLRRLLGRDLVITGPAGYALRLGPDDVDVGRFEHLVASGRAAARDSRPGDAAQLLGEALRLWRGPALVEFRGWPWAEGTAARLDEMRLGVIEEHIAAELDLGRAAEVVPELEALVTEHPLREGLWSQLIVALYRSGRQADALRAFAALRERLADELGIVPGPALQQLERDVLLQAPGLQLEAPVSAAATVQGQPGSGDDDGDAPSPANRDAVSSGPELGTVLCCRFGGSIPPADLERLASELARRFGGEIAGGHDPAVDVTAVFGAAGSEEDHALRAAAAACAIRRDVEARRHGTVACGLHSGPTGDADSDRATAAHAASLVEVVPAGAVQVSATTAHLLRRRARLEPFDGAVGHDGACRLVSLAGGRSGEAFQLAALSPFVGRHREMERLVDLAQEADAGRGQVVGITGEAGMGKSRLVYELRARLEGQAVRWLEGWAAAYGANVPWFAARPLLVTACGDDAGDDLDVAAVGAAVDQVGGPPEWAALLGDMVDSGRAVEIDQAPGRKARMLDVFRRFLLRVARQRMLVVVIEDAHWCDPTSEELLAGLADSLVDARVLLLVTYRPGYRPPWAGLSYASQIALRPLDGPESLTVARGATGPAALSTQDEQAIVDRADGNPLFVEELARALVSGPGEALPDTLTGVLQASLAGLPEAPKRLLQTAAVLGRSFPSSLLAALWTGPVPLDAAFAELRRRELLYESNSTDDARYVFRHVLTQQVAYTTLSEEPRAGLHTAAAEALERLHAGREDQVEPELAHHWGRSGRSQVAVQWLRRVARTAVRQNAHQEALNVLEEAALHAARLPAQERERELVDVLLAQANSLFLLGRLPELVSRLDAERGSLEATDDPALTGQWHFWLAHAHCLLGHPRDSAAHAAIAARAATVAGDAETLGKTHYVLAVEGLWSSQHRAGAEHGRTAVAILERGQEPYWLGIAHWVIAINLVLLGDLDGALGELDRCEHQAELISDRRLAAYASFTRSYVLGLQGNGAGALEEARRGVERAADPYTVHGCRCFVGRALFAAGDPGAAVAELGPAITWLLESGLERLAWWMSSFMAEAMLAAGDHEGAYELATTAVERNATNGFGFGSAEAQRVVARAVLARSEVAGVDLLARSAQAFAEVEASFEEAVTRVELAQHLVGAGEVDAARAQLQRAAARFESCGVASRAEHARVLARSLPPCAPATPL
ncbi:MAG: BTAD domain-containing putative transcriptional regulator [Acidimicrobiales bacterium]